MGPGIGQNPGYKQALEFTQKIQKWMTNLTSDLIKQQKVYSRINPMEVMLNTMKCLSLEEDEDQDQPEQDQEEPKSRHDKRTQKRKILRFLKKEVSKIKIKEQENNLLSRCSQIQGSVNLLRDLPRPFDSEPILEHLDLVEHQIDQVRADFNWYVATLGRARKWERSVTLRDLERKLMEETKEEPTWSADESEKESEREEKEYYY
ncbi:unnamed protein product [Bursaphelenchus okinawaensis]|uniref:Uncharacterized protein n=1 Tax=Bursaphelenchus okinawaensis TaxID=465554 RepID=A0A811KS42_9BILA|nr:unnamed protein product [Bursaphelenchus okinawaensis]CAG9110860.1 unnamed protein product [Bursaphelenchus okinawaensis]